MFHNRYLWLWLPIIAILVMSTLSFRGISRSWFIASSATAYLTAAMILHQHVNPLKGDYEPIAGLGRISYSVYLLHALFFDYTSRKIFPTPLQDGFEFFLIIVTSALTYRYIELPFIGWSKRRTESSSFAITPVAAPAE